MPDTEKLPRPEFTTPCTIADAFRRIFQRVERDTRGGTAHPLDPGEAQVALRVVNDVLDRMEEAIDAFVQEVRQVGEEGGAMPLARWQLKALKLLRERIEMRPDRCSFGMPGPVEPQRYPTKEAEVDDFIRERTRLWRETWLLSVIDALVENKPGNVI